MKYYLIRASLMVTLSVFTAVASSVCYDITSTICGANQLYDCATYCATTASECASSGVTTRISVRNRDRCNTGGTSWRNCDDREGKTTCTEVYNCLSLSDVECVGAPGTFQCVKGGGVVSTTRTWTTISSIFCG